MKYEKKSWWVQRTSLERTLLLVVSLCIIISVSLLVSLTIVAIKKTPNENSETATIITTTSEIITTSGDFETTTSTNDATNTDTTLDSSISSDSSSVSTDTSMSTDSSSVSTDTSTSTEASSSISTDSSSISTDSSSISTDSSISTGSSSVSTDTSTDSSLSTDTSSSTDSSTTVDNSICLSEACKAASQAFASKMDQTVEPCKDFYQFACGTFLKENEIPDNKASITTINVIEDELMFQLRDILDEPMKDDEIIPFQNVRKLYSSCMNTNQANSRGHAPLHDILQQLGEWPVISQNWYQFSWDWGDFFAKSMDKGLAISSLFTLEIDTDIRNTSRRTIIIDQPQLGLERQFLLEGGSILQAYSTYQVDVAVLLGSRRVTAQQKMQAALVYEIELAKISSEERRDPLKDYTSMTINELQTKYRNINWLKYLNDILPEGIDLQSSDTIVNLNVDFFEKLQPMLLDDKEVIANYVGWRVVMNSIDYLSDDLKNLQNIFKNVLHENAERAPRWQECVDVVLDNYPIALGSLYVQKHFSEESKTVMLETVNSIKTEFQEHLKTIEWMDPDTRESAIAKLDAMKFEIGFAEEIMNEEKLEEFHANFPDVDEDHYYETIHSLKAASAERSFNRLNDVIADKDWFDQDSPATVKTFYNVLENALSFPAGILQGSFFSADRPKYMNYGAIGAVIGHQITHSVYDEGSQFDSEGNFRDWWSSETREQFLEQAHCIINQYSSYIEPQTQLGLNGINTLNKNIADNGGVKNAYNGYIKWVDKNGSEGKLPDLSYKPNQLFWISLGQMFCSIYRDSEMQKEVMTGIYAPPQFRVLGSLRNSKEFSKDFDCALETDMNPIQKCEIW